MKKKYKVIARIGLERRGGKERRRDISTEEKLFLGQKKEGGNVRKGESPLGKRIIAQRHHRCQTKRKRNTNQNKHKKEPKKKNNHSVKSGRTLGGGLVRGGVNTFASLEKRPGKGE